MGYNLLINGVYWGYNPLTNHFLTSWDIQVVLYSAGNPCPLQALKALELPGTTGLDPMVRLWIDRRDGTVQLERDDVFFFLGGGGSCGWF